MRHAELKSGLMRWRKAAGYFMLVVFMISLNFFGVTAPTLTFAQSSTYTNPIRPGDFADPTIIKGKDGYWYAYATGDRFQISRSEDLQTWTNMGTVFASKPAWASGYSFWAPDIRYIDGQYVLYYSVINSSGVSAIGAASAPSPTGPWTDRGSALLTVGATLIDPAGFTDTDGTNYVLYGSYPGGVWIQKLNSSGLSADPAFSPVKIASGKYEGPYMVHRDGFYYLMLSSSSCCAGPSSGYVTYVGKSASLLGSYVDRDGIPLVNSRSGGTIMMSNSGNSVLGGGHNAMLTDLSGQTYIVYHALNRYTAADTVRQLHIDRLDWIDGWPIVREGRGASATPQPMPIVTGTVDDRFGDSVATANNFVALQGSFSNIGGAGTDSGAFMRLTGPDTMARVKVLSGSDVQVQADVRTMGTADVVGLLSNYVDKDHYVRILLDAATNELQIETVTNGIPTVTTTSLPSSFEPDKWHTLTVQVRGNHLKAEVTHANLGDPLAVKTTTLPNALVNQGVAGIAGDDLAEVDNFSLSTIFTAYTSLVSDPPIVSNNLLTAYSDEFTGSLGAGWSWIRNDPNASVQSGSLTWPTQSGDLAAASGKPGVLLRSPPKGNYMIETKLNFNVGINTIRDFEQAGLIVYTNDNNHLRLVHSTANTLRLLEFWKVTQEGGGTRWAGATNFGVPADTTWLCINVTIDPVTGEQHYRPSSSTDGVNWKAGGVWVLPANTSAQIGLVSHGRTNATQATAKFEYFRVFQNKIDRTEGDVTGDKYGDLTTIDADGRLSIYANGFLEPAHNGYPFVNKYWTSLGTSWGADTTAITTADLTGDGKAELLALGTDGHLRIWKNTGSTTPWTFVTWDYVNWSDAIRIAAGDVNGDGLADLVSTHTDGSLRIHVNTGNASASGTGLPFNMLTWSVPSGYSSGITGIAVADTTGDGYADLLVARSDGTLTEYANQWPSAPNQLPFAAASWSVSGEWDDISDISASDVNGDGWADLMALTTMGQLQIYANKKFYTGAPFDTATWIYYNWSGVSVIG
jgi:arabinan endo-1,5-alpha-L-arabinosidase